MILLLGGTSETAPIATGLAAAGFAVLVSTATDEPLDIGTSGTSSLNAGTCATPKRPPVCGRGSGLPLSEGPLGGAPLGTDRVDATPRPGSIERRVGRLDDSAMANLVRARAIQAIVDAAHPYAAAAHATAAGVAEQLGLPYFAFVRQGMEQHSTLDTRRLTFAVNHEQAADLAFSLGRAVLLTTGSNNLAPYVRRAREANLPLAVRVLPRDDSLAACRRAGIADDRIIAAKGPFSVEANREHIRRFNAGVLVTKDSGQAGGVDTKLLAARLEGCAVVVVRRPAVGSFAAGRSFSSIDDLLAAVVAAIPPAAR